MRVEKTKWNLYLCIESKQFDLTMIKDRIVKLLNQYIGQYVENIDENNLNYSILKGELPPSICRS